MAEGQGPPSTPPLSTSSPLRLPQSDSVDMSSPAPLLRPPIPGSRNQSGSRTPKLGLAIPPSPHVRPLNPAAVIDSHAMPPLQIPRNAPPKLSLATPMGSRGTPQETRGAAKMKLPPLQVTGLSASAGSVITNIGGPGGGGGGSSDDSAHSRSNSFGASNPNYSTSTNSSVSALNFNDILRNSNNSQDPLSAYSSSSAGGLSGSSGLDNDIVLPDLEMLSIQKGRPLDVEDLDDAGWKAAAKENRIEELGSLGEGAGGAVNRCRLKGGKTVFALKVRFPEPFASFVHNTNNTRSSRPTLTQTSRNRLSVSCRSTKTAPHHIYADTTVPL